MKSKKLILVFFLLSVSLISILPLINTVNFFKNHSWQERRQLKKKVLFNIDKIETVASYIVYKLFNKSIFPNDTIVGKNGFLFLGNNYANVFSKTNGTFFITDNAINQYVQELRKLQIWYEERGIDFVIAIAPNKHSIYKEKLPSWAKFNGETITDRILKACQGKQIHILDLRDALLQKSIIDHRLLYHKTDTHWNMLGASVGYEKIIDYMNEALYLSIPKASYSVEHIPNDNHVGDLAGFLKIKDVVTLDDKNTYAYRFKTNTKLCHGNINNESGKLEKCSDKENPITTINWQAQYTVNENIQSKKLLFMGDSFSKNPSQLYNASFNTIWKFHYRKLIGENLRNFIIEQKPDVVLYQIVERDLYNNIMFQVLK
ncbi:MAG: hypothetical protein JW802_11500 [Campylobacterales bacterium]|nr:hypothetical protein [Campylobacterales bacterium]MBN2832926.1 hypothetical protein [Campylobacterales bacterium]